MLFLPLKQDLLLVRVREDLEHDPFGDLRAVNTGRVGDGDFGVFPDGSLKDMICAGAEEVEEFEVWDEF